MPTYYVENFGCRATQADGAALERQFEERGLSPASNFTQADLVVINSCTVTAAADQDARAVIRRIRRQNRDARIIVTGCYAQRAPEEVAALPGVSAVIGNSHKHQLAEIALRENEYVKSSGSFIPLQMLSGSRKPEAGSREPEAGGPIFVSDIFAHTELLAAPVFDAPNQRTRPNLKVQDGCDNRCSFCVIPYVRGQSRSLPLAQIIAEVDSLVGAGYREVVISGINLGRWGRDLGPQTSALGPQTSAVGPHATDFRSLVLPRIRGPRSHTFRRPDAGSRKPGFEDLVCAILSETELEKLRISSVEPMDWTDDLISLVAESPRIAKHAHVPMQSGSDAVLRRMHRKYRPWHYREKIEKIRAAMPTAAIGADVMVGFPGETDAEFDSTRRMIEDLPFTYLHVFTYSPRPGTPAATMPNQVPIHVARERNRILRYIAAEKKQAFMHSFIGRTLEAITLKPEGWCDGGGLARESASGDSGPFTTALTDNYLKLRVKGEHAPNQWVRVRVEEATGDTLLGYAIPE